MALQPAYLQDYTIRIRDMPTLEQYFTTKRTNGHPFHRWLDHELKERGWTQTELSRRIGGIARSTVSGWISTDNPHIPSPRACTKIAGAFDLPVAHVLSRAGHVPPVKQETEQKQKVVAMMSRLEPDEVDIFIAMAEALVKTMETKRKN